MDSRRIMALVVLLAAGASTVSASTCGAGTTLDPATDTCIVANTQERQQERRQERRQAASPRIATEDGNLLVRTNGGSFGVEQQDGTTTYIDGANTIPSAIQLGYNLMRDMSELHNMVSVRESLRGEINDVSSQTQSQMTRLQDDVNTSVTRRMEQVASIIAAANSSLSEVSNELVASLSAMATCAERGMLLGDEDQCVLPGASCQALSTIRRTNGATFGKLLREPAAGAQEIVECSQDGFGPSPSSVQCLRDGRWSNNTVTCQNCTAIACEGDNHVCVACSDGVCIDCREGPVGSAQHPGSSCLNVLRSYIDNDFPAPPSGLYYLRMGRTTYQTYCDMETNGGGWTLTASIHEDNVRSHQPNGNDRWTGRTTSDRGAQSWYDTTVFGNINNVARADYKNQAYFNVNASDTMVWHVNNGASIAQIRAQAWARYYTRSSFLSNLNPPNYVGIFSGTRRTALHNRRCGVKLSTPIVWDTTNSIYFYNQIAPNVRTYHMGGVGGGGENNMDYAIGCDGDCGNCMFAMCPGVSFVNGCGNTEHACIGGAISRGSFQTDFTEWDYSGLRGSNQGGYGWSSGGRILRSATVIFVR